MIELVSELSVPVLVYRKSNESVTAFITVYWFTRFRVESVHVLEMIIRMVSVMYAMTVLCYSSFSVAEKIDPVISTEARVENEVYNFNMTEKLSCKAEAETTTPNLKLVMSLGVRHTYIYKSYFLKDFYSKLLKLRLVLSGKL